MSITTSRSKLTFIVTTVLTVIFASFLLSIFPRTMAENADNMMSENMTAADNMMAENMTVADNMMAENMTAGDNMMAENMTAADNMMAENMTAEDNMIKTYEDT